MIKRIYLATPYTSTSPDVREYRFNAVTKVAALIVEQGGNVYSPITMGHVICKYGELPPDFAFWSTSCLSFVKHWATDVYVLMLPGWEVSVGVTAEVDAAKALNIPVTHILPLPCNHDLPLAV